MASAIKGLFFDMFGTMLDFRGSVSREAKAILEPRGHSADWGAFTDAWRAEYRPSMNEVIAGKRPFVNLDVLHRENLQKILPRYGINGLDDATVDHLNAAWHRLDTWPEVPAAHARLRKKFYMATLSNGNVSMMADVARRNGLHWDAILGAEYAKIYKMEPGVYKASYQALDLKPDEALMCAAHALDLEKSANTGMRTAFIHRPDEFGIGKGEPRPPEGKFDYVVGSLAELADKLGA